MSDRSLPDPRLAERETANMHRILRKQHFGTAEEAHEFAQSLFEQYGGRIPYEPPETPVEQAQELVYKAWASDRKRDRVRLAKEALKIYPNAADAYNILAVDEAEDDEETLAFLEQAVAAGERHLGPEYLSDPEAVGQLWMFLEARPYMRALHDLSIQLWDMGRHNEAIAHAKKLLRLNRGDNQGVRDSLVMWLIAVNRDLEAQQLLTVYPNDPAAVWSYARALLAFRKHGPGKQARKALRKAFETNPYVPLLMLSDEEIPEEPRYYALGTKSEAVETIYLSLQAWAQTPGALDWMGEEFVDSVGKVSSMEGWELK